MSRGGSRGLTPLLIGLDVGTTAVKAAAFDEAGDEIAQGRAPTPWRTVPTGAEVDPDALLAAAVQAARAALQAAGGGQVLGIGVASMAETGVLLDRAGRPVVPSIAWHDSRGGDEAARLAAGLAGFDARVGLPASPLCTIAKYAWMRGHLPESEHGVRWLNVAEWIVLGLGGEPAAELSLASRTGFYDLHARRPWDEALAWADAPRGLVEEAVVAGTPMGTVGDALPEARGAALTVGGHDHLAAAVGAGAAGEGDVLDSCGTAEAFVRASAPLPPDRVARAVAGGITVGWHAVAGRHALLGAQWAGAALARILALLGVAPEERAPMEAAALAIERDAPARDASSAHARGESPAAARDASLAHARGDSPAAAHDDSSSPAHNGAPGGVDDPSPAAPAGLAVHGVGEDTLTLTGIGRDASPAAAYHAALEAVGTGGAEVLARMAAVAGPPRRLVVTGGWAAGEAARAVKERHLGPFELSPTLSAGARGAALAAGRAAGAR